MKSKKGNKLLAILLLILGVLIYIIFFILQTFFPNISINSSSMFSLFVKEVMIALKLQFILLFPLLLVVGYVSKGAKLVIKDYVKLAIIPVLISVYKLSLVVPVWFAILSTVSGLPLEDVRYSRSDIFWNPKYIFVHFTIPEDKFMEIEHKISNNVKKINNDDILKVKYVDSPLSFSVKRKWNDGESRTTIYFPDRANDDFIGLTTPIEGYLRYMYY